MSCPVAAKNSVLDDPALAGLVEEFYARVRADEELGALFAAAIPDGEWPAHLGRMAQFWSSVMLGSGRYHGNPVAAHLKHRAMLHPAMFARWLTLWEQATRACLAPDDADAALIKARRIAESLQLALFFRLPADMPSARAQTV